MVVTGAATAVVGEELDELGLVVEEELKAYWSMGYDNFQLSLHHHLPCCLP